MRTAITWAIGGPGPVFALDPDVELTVNRAPVGVALPTDVSIDFLRKADGSIRSCHPSPTATSAPASLVDVACRSEGEPPLRIVRNIQAQPVDALDSAKVRFVVDKH
jgi:hypothetical protein